MNYVRLKEQQKKVFIPITLEIDINNMEELNAYLELFVDWDTETYELLLAYKEKMIGSNGGYND